MDAAGMNDHVLPVVAASDGGIVTSLHPLHLEELRKSGISPELAAAHDIRTITDSLQILGLLRYRNRKRIESFGPCMVLPYFNHKGIKNGYCRVKPSRPPCDDKGKASKYLGPKDQRVRIYFTRLRVEEYLDPHVPILITEGEKKALSASQHGVCTVGIGGVGCWSKKRSKDGNGKPVGERELHPDLAELPWKEREVFIAFDSDRTSKPEVMREECSLARALAKQGAIVRIVELPPSSDNTKQGVDDYLVAHGIDAFKQLMADAREPVAPQSKKTLPRDSVDNPHRLAHSFLARESTPEHRLLHCWNGEFIKYENGAYRIQPQADLKPRVTEHIRSEFVSEYLTSHSRKVTRPVKVRQLTDVMNALQSTSRLPASIQPPAWIGKSALRNMPDPSGLLTMNNGILQLDAAKIRSNQALLPPNPDFFTTHAIPFDYVGNPGEPMQWQKFLRQLWPSDDQSIATLQEWFGYLLTSETRLQKMLMLIGPKRSGKGTILRILAKMVGHSNIVSPTLSSLGTQFGLAPLLGKSVAIISDARLGNRNDQAVITERLLSITGEDIQTVERKYRESFVCKLLTRFVLASNELPRLTDSSGALSGRMIMLKMTNSFFGKEDTHLEEKLSEELPAILHWSIAGLIRLRERGLFVQPQSSQSLAQELDDLVSPIGAFVRDECIADPTEHVEISALYKRWLAWCEENGRQQPGTSQSFGRDLHAACASISVNRPVIDGKRVRVYQGIRLRRLSDSDPDLPSATSAQSADIPIVTNRKQVSNREGEESDEITIRKSASIADCADGLGPIVPAETEVEGVFYL